MLDGLLTPAECGVLLQLAKVRRPTSRWRSWLGRNPQAWLPASLLLGCPMFCPLILQWGLGLPLPHFRGQVSFSLNLEGMGWTFCTKEFC